MWMLSVDAPWNLKKNLLLLLLFAPGRIAEGILQLWAETQLMYCNLLFYYILPQRELNMGSRNTI